MHVFLALPYYLSWHYGAAFSDMKNIWKNFIVFLYNFFSLPTLIKTLFSPWHRMGESYERLEDFLGNLLINTMMRLVGVIIRLMFIILGVLSIALCILFGACIFVVWLVLPFLLIYMILQGVYLLTK